MQLPFHGVFSTLCNATQVKAKLQSENAAKAGRNAKIRCQLAEGEAGLIENVYIHDHEASAEPDWLAELAILSDEALDTDDEEVDPSFDLDMSVMIEKQHIIETFCKEWITSLDWEDRTSLGLFLCFQLNLLLHKCEAEAAELAGLMIGRSDRTV